LREADGAHEFVSYTAIEDELMTGEAGGFLVFGEVL